MDKDKVRELLRRALNDSAADFRDGQYEAIAQIVERRARLLVVQRTGWGKSLVYFLATRLLRDAGAGLTLIISPLLALMRNQIVAAGRIGIRAATINSDNKDEWESVSESLRAGGVDVLLISPERLANEAFRRDVLMPTASRIGLFVVDEAHCISDWGHDFRPDYRRITRVLLALPPNIPVLATTATANNRVVADVQAQLGASLQISRGPLVRESLRLQNIALPGQAARMAWLAEQIPKMPGSGIVYALTVRDAERLAAWLQSQNIDAQAYHGAALNREELEARLLTNTVKALVATTALGMGFDKPDLGFVIHYQRPGSVVHYYQQVGRAGRAVPEAFGVLLSGGEDAEIIEYFIQTAFPPEAHVAEVLTALQTSADGLTTTQMQRQANLSFTQLTKTLKMLSAMTPAPVGKDGARWLANPVPYAPDTERVAQLTALRRHEQARMDEYAQSKMCLMQFLARELDDPNPMPCGRCAVCAGGPLLPETFSRALAAEAMRFLQRNDQTIAPRKQCPDGALESMGWPNTRIPADEQAEKGRALCVWGDDGWGQLVKDGKRGGRFDDALVEAAAALVRERWHPTPAPVWVTCIPSLSRPTLVPDFARRLAEKLGLPFAPCVTKTRPTPAQKTMQNSFQQAKNLDGAFAVAAALPGPVLLIDDLVDSKWTFTVIAALLRRAGGGPVFPLALAVTTPNESD